MNSQEITRKFALWISELTYSTLEEDSDNYIFKAQTRNSITYTFITSKEELMNEIKLMNESKQDSVLALSTGNKYEILLREENDYGFSSLNRISRKHREEGDDDENKENIFSGITDHENKVTYTLNIPSVQFILFLIEKASADGNQNSLRIGGEFRAKHLLRRFDETYNIFEYIRILIGEYYTLRITSVKEKKILEFEKFSSAILFNIAYNTNISLVQYKNIYDVVIPQRIANKKRAFLNQIEPPRRFYIPSIINYYQLAIGSKDPVIQYISYYHIIEHFFEEVFNDSLINKVKDIITNPNFSYKNKKDIKNLIKEITRSVRIQKDATTFKEIDALKLTLEKYIDIPELTNELDEYDLSLINYYENNDVSFSGAKKLNIRGKNNNSLYDSISNRIYKNRNSIVHSKESEMNKYTPFHDNQALSKEIPLIKLISEQIVIKSSNPA